MDRGACRATVHGVGKRHDLATKRQQRLGVIGGKVEGDVYRVWVLFLGIMKSSYIGYGNGCTIV